LKEHIKTKLEEMQQKGAEIEVEFIWTCSSVPIEERGVIVSLEENCVVLKDRDNRENIIKTDAIFKVNEIKF